jgi:hypothetical protein
MTIGAASHAPSNSFDSLHKFLLAVHASELSIACYSHRLVSMGVIFHFLKKLPCLLLDLGNLLLMLL